MILRRHVPQACPYRHVRANQPRIHRAPECGEAAVGDLSRVQVESDSFSRLGWAARVPIRSPFIKGNQGSCCVLSARAGVRRRRTCGTWPRPDLTLFGDPLGRDWIAGRESLFDGLVDQLLLALLQVLAGNPVTGRGCGGPAWIGLPRAAFLLTARRRARAARGGCAWSGVRWSC